MSESIQSGYLPLWNPYINFGLPQYGDMSSGFWSPVTWLIASTIGYTCLYSFTIELLGSTYWLPVPVCIFFAGFMALRKLFPLLQELRICAAVIWSATCNISTGSVELHCFPGACGLNQFQKRFSLKNSTLAAILFYLLVSSSHPGIIIGSIVLFYCFIMFSYFRNRMAVQFQRLSSSFIPRHIVLFIALFLVYLQG